MGGACVRLPRRGRRELEGVEGVEEAEADDGVAWVRVYREPGAAIGRCGTARTASAQCSPSARAARMPSPGVSEPPGAYAFGSPMSTPPSSRSSTRRETFLGFQPPAMGDEEIAAVAETLRSGWLTTGQRGRARTPVRRVHRRDARAGVARDGRHAPRARRARHGPGDEVITTSITWPATANVVVHAGATPVFADVRPADLNIDPNTWLARGPRTKAILPVHLAGQPADLDPSVGSRLPVVEDAAHAVESEYRGRKIGASPRRRASRSTRRRTSPRGGRRHHDDLRRGRRVRSRSCG